MRKLLSVSLSFLLVAGQLSLASAQNQSPQNTTATQSNELPRTVFPAKRNSDGKLVLEDGTPVRLRITRTISSADSKTGDRVDFEVMDTIKLGDVVVIPQGSIAWATVTEAQHKKSMGRAGKLNVNIDAVKLANGEKANLRAVKETKGGGHVGAMTGAMVATGIVFFPAAPLFLFMHGKDITIPKGTEIVAYVNGDTVFEPLAPPAPPTPAPTTLKTELAITSAPDAADVEIDGAFVGNTPSTIEVDPGEHVITVKKKGFASWERKLKVGGGHINLKAELEPEQATPSSTNAPAQPDTQPQANPQ